ncbi:MAG: DNRLRE domain-containing protein [Deltaproteobacteria bacterium]|nr:DNRLRE domain-containing protein [Deltaproteobacteria bacterium]
MSVSWVVVAGLVAACSESPIDTDEDLEVAAGAPVASYAAGSVVVLPEADTYVRSGSYASRAYGGAVSVQADRDASGTTKQGLLRFRIPSGSTVVSAKLLVYVVNPSGNAADLVSMNATSWSESDVTWNTRPAMTGAVVASIARASASSWVEVDVTSGVVGQTVVSLAVLPRSTDGFAFSSRETGAQGPRLVLTLAGATPDAGVIADAGVARDSGSGGTADAATPTGELRFPIRAAFYYPWFPEAWTQSGIYPYTKYHPTLGYYSARDAQTLSKHIRSMQYGHVQAGISSWWGPGHHTDTKVPGLLSAAHGTSFKWSLYYELESQGDPSPSTITAHLTHIRDRYASDPSFLRIGGRFVVFVYTDGADGCAMAQRWKQANTVGAYVVLKVFSGYRTCASQPDGWHQYAPAVATDSQLPHSYAISPGFDKVGDPTRLGRDLARFQQNVRDMVASGANWQLVTTFNEWGEGTAVESASEWATASGDGAYLDALHAVPGSGGITSTPDAAVVRPDAGASQPDARIVTADSAPPSSSDPIVAAAGDIACDPSDGNFNGGRGTTNNCRQMATSDLMLAIPNLAKVLVLGDIQYEDGTLAKYMASYDPSWGRLKAKSAPAVGNHEYLTAGAAGYFGYFGAAAGDPAKGYYSYDVGTWHVVVLNSNCSKAGGCGAGSPQERWLRADLAAHPTKCTLAYWHHPRFSSGQHGSHTTMTELWQALYDYNAELVLSGHDHDYERFAPQTASGAADPARGLRQFVVGTGGKNHYGFNATIANSEVRNADTYGVLRLTLRPGSVDWKFLPEPGKTFTDSGTMVCH